MAGSGSTDRWGRLAPSITDERINPVKPIPPVPPHEPHPVFRRHKSLILVAETRFSDRIVCLYTFCARYPRIPPLGVTLAAILTPLRPPAVESIAPPSGTPWRRSRILPAAS